MTASAGPSEKGLVPAAELGASRKEPLRSFVRSSVLLDFRRLALSLGLDPLALMARASISRRYLDDPELILPMGEVVQLLEISARVSRVDDFGMQLAEMRGLPDLGPIMLLLREETTVRTALKSLAAMLHMHSDALYLYLDERESFTSWELNMLSLGLSLTGKPTGWLRQMPQIAERLTAIPGLLSVQEVDQARSDWDGTCDVAQRHGLARFKEIARVARVHRDPFEPILPILEHESPVGAYREITLEILRRMPDRKRYPRTAAEASRSFLMLRFGLDLGVRQKNLRQLLVCPRTSIPRTDRQLEKLRRGELRWNVREEGWEVLIPSNAFKNSNSSFFGHQPFRLLLPDLDGLYAHIEDFIGHHRDQLLNGAPDPGTFFIKTVKRTSRDASYNSATFYEAWRLIIQRYGIYNPYTERGAIKGLLPHGPLNIRDVLATHVLKRTGSYEQASYAIQDTPEMVAQHYGRFLPQHKAELAAKVLNEAWHND